MSTQKPYLLVVEDIPDILKLLEATLTFKGHRVDLPVTSDLDFEPLRDGVDALGADAVGAAGEFVTALAVFAAGVKRSEDQLHARDVIFLMDVYRDATAVVADAD